MERTFLHPQFGRLTFSQTRRAKRITITVRPPGNVRISYPPNVSQADADAFLERKTQWLRLTLDKMRRRWPETLIKDGQRTRTRRVVLQPASVESIRSRVTDREVTVTFPDVLSAESPEVQQAARKALERALIAEARHLLPAMTESLGRRHGLKYRSVTVRCARTRWGSCSYRNDISLNAYLLLLPDRLIEYVIVHELCHTAHKDHSPGFHALVDKLLKGREKELRTELRTHLPGMVRSE